MKGLRNESAGVSGLSLIGVIDEFENAVSRKLFGHVNVVDVDIGVICRGDRSLDGLIEESRVLIQLDAGGSGDQAPRRACHAGSSLQQTPPGLNGAVRSATVRRVSSISSRRSGHPWLLRPFIEF
jgi:hypothetical protein